MNRKEILTGIIILFGVLVILFIPYLFHGYRIELTRDWQSNNSANGFFEVSATKIFRGTPITVKFYDLNLYPQYNYTFMAPGRIFFFNYTLEMITFNMKNLDDDRTLYLLELFVGDYPELIRIDFLQIEIMEVGG